jgi:GH15 family glucan-1,4-alpha-glucosidase
MDLMKKSIEVLKCLQLKNGGILATPLSGAYPYVYTRDGVMITKAFNRLNLTDKSEKFYYFLKNYARLKYFREAFQRYTEGGYPSVTRKHQHDNTALLIHGIYDTYIHSGNKRFLRDMWPVINIGVDFIISHLRNPCKLVETDTSIHEFYRLEHGYEIWVNSASCRALYDATEMAKVLNSQKAKKWQRKAEELNKSIKEKLFNKKTGLYMKSLTIRDEPDMSQLSPFYFDIDDSKDILRKTLAYLRKHLWYSTIGGYRRFRKFCIVRDWHWYTGGSGSWVNLTLWAATFHKKLGNKKEHTECIKFIEKTAARTEGLLPEHVAPKKEFELWKKNEIEFNKRVVNGMREAETLNEKFKKKFKEDIVYWATPLGWAHAEYILYKKGHNGL